MTPSLDLALDYLTWHPDRYLFPIHAGKKTPPHISDNLKSASNDPEKIKKWHAKWPGCFWGLSHEKSGLIVVDVDRKPGKFGQYTYDVLDLEHGWAEKTETNSTPSGGLHYVYDGKWFYKCGLHSFALGENGFGRDLDSPHYSLIPGQTLAVGGTYESVSDAPVVPAPQWFLEYLGKVKKNDTSSNESSAVVELDKPENVAWAINYLKNDAPPAIEGQSGDITTFKVACELRGRGIGEINAKTLMEKYYNVWPTCDPIWEINGDLGLYKKVENAYAYASIDAPGEATAEADFADDPVVLDDADKVASDAARAERLGKKAEVEAKEAAIPFDQKTAVLSFAQICEDWVHVADAKRFIKRDDLDLMWDKEQFDDYYSYAKGKAPKISKTIFERTKSTMPKCERMVYMPGKPEIFAAGTKYNLYRAPDLVVAPGDTALWNAHLAYLFPDETVRDHVLNWCAWLLQNLARKPKHALLVAGYTQGTGKSFIAEMLTAILGEANVSPIGEDELNGQFNEWALRSKLITIEELRTIDKGHVAKKLHPLITQTRIKINDKNVKRFTIDNCFGFFMMTNDDAAISLDNSDRRYLVARTHAVPNDKAYYDALYKLLEDPAAIGAVAYELQHRAVGEYSGQARAPFTEAKGEMILAGLTDLEHWMMDHAGEYPLSARIITIDDVVDVLPSSAARTTRTRTTITSILRHRFKGEPLGQHRLAHGERASLWAINGTGATKIEGVNYAKVYETDRAEAGSGKSVNAAVEEFSS